MFSIVRDESIIGVMMVVSEEFEICALWFHAYVLLSSRNELLDIARTLVSSLYQVILYFYSTSYQGFIYFTSCREYDLWMVAA